MLNAQNADEIIAGWLSGADESSPAGPLYTAGAKTESSITEAPSCYTMVCSACTACPPRECC
jgi:hypothetical protein